MKQFEKMSPDELRNFLEEINDNIETTGCDRCGTIGGAVINKIRACLGYDLEEDLEDDEFIDFIDDDIIKEII